MQIFKKAKKNHRFLSKSVVFVCNRNTIDDVFRPPHAVARDKRFFEMQSFGSGTIRFRRAFQSPRMERHMKALDAGAYICGKEVSNKGKGRVAFCVEKIYLFKRKHRIIRINVIPSADMGFTLFPEVRDADVRR